MWSPSLQARFAPNQQDVLRLALNRTYKAPALSKLVPRRYTNDNNNNPTNPDEQGNPALRPELAWGLDTSWEHYLGNGALLSISAYLRRIHDVTQTRLFQQDGVWVVAPFNDGNASARGTGTGSQAAAAPAAAAGAGTGAARQPGPQLVASGPGSWPLQPAGNQTPLTANLGLDYRLSGALTMGANLNYQAGGTARSAAQTYEDKNARRALDLYGAWKTSPAWQARLSLSGLLARSANELQGYTDANGRHTPDSASPPPIRPSASSWSGCGNVRA